MKNKILILSAILVMGWPMTTLAALVFTEDFEGGLSAWTGTGGGTSTGVISADPKQGDSALTFTETTVAGDIFSSSAFGPGDYTLTFDYLGLSVNGSDQTAGDFGGFIGFSGGLPGSHIWLDGTSTTSGSAGSLVDDDSWNSYSIDFTAGSAFHIMIEDYSGPVGIAGDAWFDNIKLYDSTPEVPLPAAAWLFISALGGLVVAKRKQLKT